MSNGAVILINGFPGVGKSTIAGALAELLPNSRIIDMPLLDISTSAHTPDSPAEAELRYRLRETVLSSLSTAATSHRPSTPGQSPPIYIISDTMYTSPPTSTYQQLYHSIPRISLIHLIMSCETDVHLTRITEQNSRAGANGNNGSGGSKHQQLERDEGDILQIRMENELCHFVKPANGNKREEESRLAGEFEIDTSRLDVGATAGILAEYVLDSLRREGWFFQLNRPKSNPQSQRDQAVDKVTAGLEKLMRK